jgi:hypothetical protein
MSTALPATINSKDEASDEAVSPAPTGGGVASADGTPPIDSKEQKPLVSSEVQGGRSCHVIPPSRRSPMKWVSSFCLTN